MWNSRSGRMIFISISQLFYLDLDVVNLVQPGMSFF